MGLAQSSIQQRRRKNKRPRTDDAPNSFTLSSKRRKDANRGGKHVGGKAKSTHAGKKHKRRKR